MALSGSFYTNVGARWRLQGEWTATQSISGNYSDVVLKTYWMGLDEYSAVYSSTTKNGTSDIHNDREIWTATAALSANQKKLIHTHSYRLAHDADGGKTMILDITFDLDGISLNGTTYNMITDTSTVELNVIPRASTLTGGQSWTAGNPVTFTVARASSSFDHDIEVEISNGSTYISLITITGVGTSYTWTPDTADMQMIFDCLNNDTTSWNQASRITLTTKSGSTVIGSAQVVPGTVSSPAASTTSSSASFDVGASVPVTITRAETTFIHTLRFYIGTTLIHTSPVGQGTSYTWVPSASEKTAMYNAMITAKTATSKIAIETFFNGTTDQRIRAIVDKTGTATIVNSNPTTSVPTYADTNAAMVTLTGNNQYLVQSKSTLRVTVLNANKAAGVNSATISKYIATVAGVSVTVNSPFATDIIFDFGALNVSANQSLTVTAYDSRGFTSVGTKTVNMVAWSPPVVNATALRIGGFQDTTDLILSGSISPVRVNGVDKNSLVPASVTYEYRVKGGTYGSKVAFLNQVLTLPAGTFTTSGVSLFLANTSAWEVLVTVTDKFGNATKTLSVGTGVPIMFIDSVKKSVGIGKFPVNTGGLEVVGGIEVDFLKILSTGDVSASSSGNGLSVGSNTGLNVKVDGNELSAFNNGTYSSLHINPDGGTVYLWNNELEHQKLVFENGGIRTEAPISPVGLVNGWTNYSTTSSAYAFASYYKDPFGIVHLDGLIKNGTTTSGTLLFTLPLGYRPIGSGIFVQHSDNTAKQVRVDVVHTGEVKIQEVAGTWISLAGISFRAL